MNNIKEPLKLGAILGIIALAVALMLSFVNGVTADKIEEVNKKVLQEGLKKALPSEQELEFILMEGVNLENSYDIDVVNLYIAINDTENVVGYCATVMPKGYAGAIETIVGIDIAGTVKGVVVTDNMSETAGLGAKAKESSLFTYQFEGKTPKFAVKSDGGQIDAITSATITSRAVTNGVNAAAEVINNNNIYGVYEFSKDDIIDGKYIVKAEIPEEEEEALEEGEGEDE